MLWNFHGRRIAECKNSHFRKNSDARFFLAPLGERRRGFRRPVSWTLPNDPLAAPIFR